MLAIFTIADLRSISNNEETKMTFKETNEKKPMSAGFNSNIAAGLPTTADSSTYASKASHSVILIKLE